MKNQKPVLYTFALSLVCLFLGVGESHAQRTFTSSNGKTLTGKITSANAQEVTIQMGNGKSIKGGVTFFSEADQKYIAEWVVKNPVQTDYEFAVKTSRSREDRRKADEGSQELVYEKWLMKIEVENRSRNGQDGADLAGLEVHYNLVKTPKADAREAGYLHQGLARGGRGTLVLVGKLQMAEIPYLKRAEVKTSTISIATSELAPDYIYTDGSRAKAADELEGIWIKIMKGDKIVHEEKIGSSELDAIKWQNP